MNSSPIFIAGCGRSGTTYLRILVDTHPDVFIPLESLFIVDYLKFEHCVPQKMLKWLFFSEPFLRAWYKGKTFNFKSATDAFKKVNEYAAQMNGAKIWGQKTPRFVLYMDLFNSKFKNIKWILIYRDPRAVSASMLKSKLHTYSLSKACKRWKKDNKPIIDILQSNQAYDNILLIKYEDLILDFDQSLEKIFNYLEIDSISRNEILSRKDISNYIIEGSKYKVTTIRDGLKPNIKNIDSWKGFLTEKQVDYIEDLCSYEMEILGYDVTSSTGKKEKKRSQLDFFSKTKDILYLLENLYRYPIHSLHFVLRKSVFIICFLLSKIFGKKKK